jgi:hypothetical protein
VLLLTDIRTSAKAGSAAVEIEKKRAHVNVETLSFASGDIASSLEALPLFRASLPEWKHLY